MNTYNTFEDLWSDVYNDCRESWEVDKTLRHLRKWMERSFYSARVQNRYQVTLEEDAFGEPLLPIPEEYLKSRGWDEHTKLRWIQLASGAWAIEEAQ